MVSTTTSECPLVPTVGNVLTTPPRPITAEKPKGGFVTKDEESLFEHVTLLAGDPADLTERGWTIGQTLVINADAGQQYDSNLWIIAVEDVAAALVSR